MSDSFTLIQGEPLAIVVQLKDSSGATVVDFGGTEALSTTVWPGGDAAPSITPTTTWVSASSGTIQIAITGTQSATLIPGLYQLITELDDGSGDPVACYTGATLTVSPAASGLAPNSAPTLLTVSEALASVPGFGAFNGPDQLALIAAATDLIEQYCGRKLCLRTHDEVHSPELTRSITLKQYPVVDVLRVCAGLANGITVDNATLVRPAIKLVPSTDATDAGATPTAVKLTGYSAGVAVSPVTLTFASYPTLTALTAAINAAGNGWSATLGSPEYADLPSTDLNPEWGTKGVAGRATPLRIFSRDLVRYDLTPATGELAIYEDRYAGHRYPDRMWAASGSYGGIRVVYTAGYNADPAAGTVTMPDALKRAAMILVQVMYQKAAVGMKLSEKTTLVSMQYGYAKDLVSIVLNLVAPFRRRRMV